MLILEKLEELYPAEFVGVKQRLSASTPEHKALEKLLEKWTDVVVFPRAAADCIPLDHPLVQDPKFIKDRTELWGEDWSRETRAAKRPEALVNMRECFELLEHTILFDGRPWVTGEDGPKLADIHAAWIFDWMMQLDGSWPSELISRKKYPQTFAWCERYHAAVEAAGGTNEVVEGPEALKRVHAAKLDGESGQVEEHDPLGLKKGQKVNVSPIDTGYTAQEEGELLSLHGQEVIVGVKTKEGADVRLHCPRWNFRIKGAQNS